jgi:peptidylprolyl isomerase
MRVRLFAVSVSVSAAVLLAACGNSTSTANGSTTSTIPGASTIPGESTTSVGPTTSTIPLPPASIPPKPTVVIPSALPTELVVTVLSEGTGEPAKAGDTVVVHYVGVRSADGVEFDNSYDPPGQAFAVEPLGQARVIDGWNQGLIGVATGSRVQLDIPASLAYGDQGRGELIRPGDALTFVIEVVAVIPSVDLTDQPTITVEGAEPASELTSKDLVTGDDAKATLGNTVAVHIIAFRGDTGAELENGSTWPSGTPVRFVLGDPANLPALNQGIVGMKVGGRRQITVPAAQAWDGAGRDELGLPAEVDVVLVVDLFAAY